MKVVQFAVVSWVSAATALMALGEPTAQKGKTVAQPFNYRGVTLLDSRWKMQFDEARDFYLRLPNDDILRGYRVRAGLPAPGADLGGCYLGHNTFGQILSGLARMYAATGDTACKDKAEALMKGWAECMAPDGFFFIEKDPQLPPYYYDKMVGGLVDLMVYCGTPDAAQHLSAITDWAIAHLDRARLYARPTGPGGGEWYTLSENLYRAYEATGDPKYKEFAAVWEYTEFWELLRTKADIFQHPMNGGWYHAYSHVNSLSGLGAAFGVTGEPRYLETLKNGYEFLRDSQFWVTGGFGPNETLMPPANMAKTLRESTNHFETQCGSWAGFKVSKYLIRYTGAARYGDWTELLALNGIGASIPMDPDGGVFYYSEYNLGGSAKQNMAPWACCSGTRPQALADIHDLIYFHDESGLYVNLFIPSRVTWNVGTTPVKVELTTRFPESEDLRFMVHCGAPVSFALKVRAPGWLAGPMTAEINGAPAPVTVDALGWAVFAREWREGDTLAVKTPMGFGVSRLLKDKPFPAALTYGPVTMVARSPQANPSRTIDFGKVSESMTPVPGDPLNFRLKSDPAVLIRPFYQMKRGERYFMYLDADAPIVRMPRTVATFSPGWIDFGAWHATNTVGASAQYSFTGDRIAILGQLYDDAGRMEVRIDGKVVGVIDQYGPARGEAKRWDYEKLGPGSHTLILTLTPDKAEASKGQFVNVNGFEFGG